MPTLTALWEGIETGQNLVAEALVLRQLNSEPTESDLLRHVSNRQCLSQHKKNRKSRGKRKPFDGFDVDPHLCCGRASKPVKTWLRSY